MGQRAERAQRHAAHHEVEIVGLVLHALDHLVDIGNVLRGRRDRFLLLGHLVVGAGLEVEQLVEIGLQLGILAVAELAARQGQLLGDVGEIAPAILQLGIELDALVDQLDALGGVGLRQLGIVVAEPGEHARVDEEGEEQQHHQDQQHRDTANQVDDHPHAAGLPCGPCRGLAPPGRKTSASAPPKPVAGDGSEARVEGLVIGGQHRRRGHRAAQLSPTSPR